jgi:Raf kinase inhibitor-like YbhB/YbcL family protein
MRITLLVGALLMCWCSAVLAAPAALHVECAAFSAGKMVPRDYTCDGADRSPALTWSGAPAATKSFAILLDDPDAPGGTFTHWIMWSVPASTHTLEAGTQRFADGQNDFGKIGYGGPCPPRGAKHRYYLHVYALDTMPKLSAGSNAAAFHQAIKGHVLAQSETMGTYQH